MRYSSPVVEDALLQAVKRISPQLPLRKTPRLLRKGGFNLAAEVFAHFVGILMPLIFVVPFAHLNKLYPRLSWLPFSIGSWSLLEAVWFGLTVHGLISNSATGQGLTWLPVRGEFIMRWALHKKLKSSWFLLLRCFVLVYVVCSSTTGMHSGILMTLRTLLCFAAIVSAGLFIARPGRWLPGKAVVTGLVCIYCLLFLRGAFENLFAPLLSPLSPIVDTFSLWMPATGLLSSPTSILGWLVPALWIALGIWSWQRLPIEGGPLLDKPREKIGESAESVQSEKQRQRIARAIETSESEVPAMDGLRQAISDLKRPATGGWIERFVLQGMDEHSRRLMPVLHRRIPPWTARFRRLLIAISCLAPFAAIWHWFQGWLRTDAGHAFLATAFHQGYSELFGFLGTGIVLLGLGIFGFIVGAVLWGTGCGRASNAHITGQTVTPLHALVPVGIDEARRMVFQISVRRALIASPLIAALFLIVAFGFGKDMSLLACIGLAVPWLWVAGTPLIVLSEFQQNSTNANRARYWRSLAWLLLGIPFLLGSAIASIVALIQLHSAVPDSPFVCVLAALAMISAFSWLCYFIGRWEFNKRWIDFHRIR